MDLLFSVILPTYNRAYVLWRAILSVLAQTETHWELLVVDDGSTDCTQRLLEEFQNSRVQSVKTENRGPAAARNTGWRLAQAPYVAYLDSDNRWPADYLESMHRAIQAHADSTLWYCGQQGVFWERSAAGVWWKIHEGVEPRAQYSVADALDLKGADTNCIVHRRAILDEIGGWDEQCRWIEDWDFFLRCMLRYPAGVTWVPDVLVEYRQVHGEGADGICGEARQDVHQEINGRRYLLQKWGDLLTPRAIQNLSMTADELFAKKAEQDKRSRCGQQSPSQQSDSLGA
jgi:glycosyltransferase involved in cell wall biosynthesis